MTVRLMRSGSRTWLRFSTTTTTRRWARPPSTARVQQTSGRNDSPHPPEQREYPPFFWCLFRDRRARSPDGGQKRAAPWPFAGQNVALYFVWAGYLTARTHAKSPGVYFLTLAGNAARFCANIFEKSHLPPRTLTTDSYESQYSSACTVFSTSLLASPFPPPPGHDANAGFPTPTAVPELGRVS